MPMEQTGSFLYYSRPRRELHEFRPGHIANIRYMQSVAAQLDQAFRSAILASFGFEADPLISVSQNDKFGDYQSNAAMGIAKRTGSNPRSVAEQLRSRLDLGNIASEISIAGPGFLNVRLDPRWLAEQLVRISPDARLGIEPTQHPQRVIIDYSAPNIAKEMHVGHLRSTIIGDAVARTLSFRSDDVVRQNHLGDWGTQFGRVVLSMWYEAVFERTGNQQALNDLIEKRARGQNVIPQLVSFHQRFIHEDPDGQKYFLPYLQNATLSLEQLESVYQFVSAVTESDEASQATIDHPQHGARTLGELPRLITKFIQDPDSPTNAQEKLAWQKARAVTIASCNDIYRQLGVQLADPSVQTEPLERGESFYNSFLAYVVRELEQKGFAVESEGAKVVYVPGYENPLIIQKADGSYLYGTTDLAAVKFRVEQLRAKRILYFVDARQSQHFAQVFWVAKIAGWTAGVSLEHAPFGTMLGSDGKPFKTREGGTTKLQDLLDEGEQRALKLVTDKNPELPEDRRRAIAHAVGIGAIKYADLSKDRISDYVFSWDKMLAMDGNTAPYLQYAYARIRSIFRKSAGLVASATTITLASPHELSLAKHILRLGDVVELVGRDLKPHYLCTYLYDLATKFSGFYENCPVLQSEEPLRSSRLQLADLTARTLALGLDMLGIEHPEQM